MVRRFVVVGAFGFVVQLTIFAVLSRLGWSWLAATAVAVEGAIVNNFAWHRSWTWRERADSGQDRWLVSFAKFNAGTAVTSIGGNVAVMALVLGVLHIEPIVANIVAVGVMSAANFLLADRWVFAARARHAAARPESVRPAAIAALGVLCLAPTVLAAPKPATITAWDKYVAETEARIDQVRLQPVTRPAGIAPDGSSIDVGSGTITHWRGAVFIPRISLAQLLEHLQDPGTPPPQEDVVASRVLRRTDDGLSVFIRLVRRSIVTVSYDTEHEMTFHRWSPTLATARSVATRIDELGGDDHGFLWRLNSYWRYQESGDGVVVALESLTLSRDVPWLIKPIAGPIASNIARESMVRTLEALKRYLSSVLS